MTVTIADTSPHLPVTPLWHNLRPHGVQSALWRTKARFAAVPAGRGSGKTELAKRRLVRYLPVDRSHLWEPTEIGKPHMYAYLAPTRPQGKRVAWGHLKRLVPREWLLGLPSESDLIIRCDFGRQVSELHVCGMDKPQRIEGNQWDGIVVDESSDQRPGAFDLSIRPALTHRQGWCWRLGVPKRQGVGAADFRAFCELGFSGNDPDVASYTWPSWDVVPEKEIEQARRNMDERDFLEQYGAAWQTIGGAAFYQFDEQANVADVIYDPTRPILVSCDFNVDPMAWTVNQLTPDGRGLNTFDELFLRNTNTQKSLDTLWARYGQNHKSAWMFYGDASSKARHASASLSDYTQIKNDRRFKATVIFPDANPAVKDRLSSMNALLRNAAGEVRWHIHSRATQLIADLRARGLDADGMPTSANKFGGHITDAAGYIIHAKWPSTRLMQETAPKIGVYFGDN